MKTAFGVLLGKSDYVPFFLIKYLKKKAIAERPGCKLIKMSFTEDLNYYMLWFTDAITKSTGVVKYEKTKIQKTPLRDPLDHLQEIKIQEHLWHPNSWAMKQINKLKAS